MLALSDLSGSFECFHDLTKIFLYNKPSILKDNFLSRIDPSTFTSITKNVLQESTEKSGVFPGLKLKSHFLPHFSDSYV